MREGCFRIHRISLCVPLTMLRIACDPHAEQMGQIHLDAMVLTGPIWIYNDPNFSSNLHLFEHSERSL